MKAVVRVAGTVGMCGRPPPWEDPSRSASAGGGSRSATVAQCGAAIADADSPDDAGGGGDDMGTQQSPARRRLETPMMASLRHQEPRRAGAACWEGVWGRVSR